MIMITAFDNELEEAARDRLLRAMQEEKTTVVKEGEYRDNGILHLAMDILSKSADERRAFFESYPTIY